MDSKEATDTMKCATFEDKNGALELEKAPKMRSRTKQTAIKCHHFRSFATKGDIIIKKVDAAEH